MVIVSMVYLKASVKLVSAPTTSLRTYKINIFKNRFTKKKTLNIIVEKVAGKILQACAKCKQQKRSTTDDLNELVAKLNGICFK